MTNIYDNCNNCAVLRESMSNAEKSYYDKLNVVPWNTHICESMAYSIMLNIMTNNPHGTRNQIRTLSSCNNCILNYKLTKLNTKMKEIGEQEGINYYRTWIEDDVWKLLRYGKKWPLFHEVNKGWVYPIIGILSGMSLLVFKHLHSQQ